MKIKCNYCSTLYDDSYSSWDNDWDSSWDIDDSWDSD